MTFVESPWGETRVKTLATKIGSGKTPTGGSETYVDQGVLFLRSQNIHFGGLRLDDVAYIDANVHREMRATQVAHNDVLLNITGASIGRVARVPEGIGEANVNQHVCIIRPNAATDSRYLTYGMSARFTQGQIQELQVGGNRDGLNFEQVGNLELPAPPLDEQRRIADFLDAETARMDRLRFSLARFDGAVREREQAVLAQMLHPGAENPGDSLPNGWKWTPLAHLTDQFRQIMYGIVLPGPSVAEGVPIIKGGDVAADRLSPRTLNRTTREIESSYARSRVKGGDLVIAIRGSVGEIAVVPEELTGANLTQDAARISISSEVSADWLRLILESPAVAYQIQQRVTGATIKGINIWDLKHVLVPTPSLAEQISLTASVNQSLGTHEALRSRVARHSDLLAERRQALITAAVTGQIDVSTASGRGIEG
jgi:type I restriction enzyme S subunit